MKKLWFLIVFLPVLLSACQGSAVNPATPQPTTNPTPMVGSTPQPQPTPQVENPTAEPTVEPIPGMTMQDVQGVGKFGIVGVPATATNQLTANGVDTYGNTFTNTIGLGSEMMIAEPGSLLVGPDEPESKVIPGKGNIEYISPINQQMLGTETFSTNTAEGAFTWATGSSMTIQVRDVTLRVESLPNACSNNWFVMIRGLFPDGKQDSDLNSTTKFSNYIPGHTQVMWYPEGAFISEGNFKQVAELSHKDGRNCGAEGTSGLSVLMLDLNTHAYTVLFQANTGQPWQLIAKNW